ncbi:MAG TPA: TRAM domain-containing protein [Gemmatimonadota bacterium]|nr:TRAM domain-containing protein [Gemmatimonadota bacterium]
MSTPDAAASEGADGGEVGRRLELEVESVAVGGDGVAREPSGRVVFVPVTAPGDRVRARVTEDRGSFLRALAEEVLVPGPDRRPPPCPYYGACGGCQLQHLEPAAQREAKRGAVRDALRRIGGLEAEVPPVREAGPRLGYRNRIALTLRRGDGGAPAGAGGADVRAGYHARGEPDRLVEVTGCPLAEPAVAEAWRALRRSWGPAARHLPAGEELRITVRGSATGSVAVLVEGGAPGEPGNPERVAAAVPGLSTYAWRPGGERRARILAGEPVLRERWQGFEVDLAPGVFLQVNRRVSEAVERSLDEGLGPVDGLRVLDLYAGVGTRAARWSLRGAEAAACEADPDAVAAGEEAASRAGASPELRAGRVEDLLGTLVPADVVVLNPPRTGLSRQVARALRERGGAARLAYVSCDPATLARDLARLAGAWELKGLEAFDAFPQTAHVETLAWLEAA